VHRAQINFDALDTVTGEVHRGRIRGARGGLRLGRRLAGKQVEVAVEACTGWLFVCEALAAAGAVAHLAEPAQASVARQKASRQDRSRGCVLAADVAV
jgi:hypothetical protein